MRTLTYPREAYIPKDAVRVSCDLPAVEVYTYGGLRLCAIAFRGKAQKPAFRYAFNTETQRTRYIADWIEGEQRTAAAKATRAAERKEWAHGFKVGDIIVNSWGWEQTNIDFYEVTGLRGKQIVIRPIKQSSEETGFMSGHCTPRPGEFTGDEIRKLPKAPWDGKGPGSISFDYGRGGIWDGKPERWSSYA